MDPNTEKLIFPKASKCISSLQKAVGLLQQFLDETHAATSPEYYSARKFHKEARAFYEEALKNAKRLLGPMPEYVTDEYLRWRENLLENYHVLAKSQELKILHDELSEDEYLNQFMSQEEIKHYLDLVFPSQKEGKRKVENIKVRIVFEKLLELLRQVEELRKKAQEKHQQAI